ncbi:MAG: hypothetical protein U9O56_07860 [Campylobacterota bacterium]|nr:hypothetical protein [Campylobacterota bacterium]
MDKKTKKKIQELIHENLEVHKTFDNYNFHKVIMYIDKKYSLEKDDKKELSDIRDEYKHNIENILFELNNLLSYENKVKEVVDLEQEIKKIQAKKYISVKEFTEIYGYSSDWQKNRRLRLNDRLPFIQTVSGGKITYDVNEVEMWFKNENITI